VSTIGSTGSTPSATAANPQDSSSTDKTKKDLGKDAFLQLLTTQLAHQDPMQPQADTEFIAQLAQFSSLEQLTEIQKTLAAMSTALGVDPSTLSSK